LAILGGRQHRCHGDQIVGKQGAAGLRLTGFACRYFKDSLVRKHVFDTLALPFVDK
jgi:hypothetical protein